MVLSEKEIIKKCQDGDWSGFDLIYDEYIKKIYRFIYLKTMHKEIAEDLTSQTFLKVVSKISSFDVETNFSSWIYTIARNLVTDFFRSKKEELNIEDIWDLNSHEDMLKNVINKQDLEKVFLYLKKINKSRRELILMRIWGGMSFKEISEVTGRSEGSLKMDFMRSIRRIRQDVLVCLVLIAITNFHNLK